MSNRPTTLLKDGTLYWVLSVYNSSGVLVDADSTPSVTVRKNGSATSESVTVTKRGSSTGLYDCSLNPSLEAEGDTFHLEEQLDISSVTYNNTWSVVVTESIITPDNASIASILADTADLQANQGQWLTATGFSTHAASDVVTAMQAVAGDFKADVSTLSTQASVDVIDGIVDDILLDTAELQTNQGDWATATGFNTVAPDNASITAIKSKTDQMVFTNANELDCNAVSGGSGGDATASNQSAIITHLTDIKGSGFASTDALEAIRDRGDSAWTTGGSGSGIYSLTVTCQDSSGSAVANVRVNIDGTTTTLVTNSSGQCVFNLDAGDYSLVASPPSEFNTPADTAVTVSADGSQTITLTQASTSGSAGWVG